MDTFQLFQLIKQPTRVTQNSETLIDLIITNSKGNTTDSGSLLTSLSDHNLIYTIRKIGIPRGLPKYIKFRSFKNFKQEDFLKDIRNTFGETNTNLSDFTLAWTAWKSKMLTILDKHAPSRTRKVRNRPSPWVTKEIKQEMYVRDLLKKKAIKSNASFDWLCFKNKKKQSII